MAKKKATSGGELFDIVNSLREHVKSENIKSQINKLPSIIDFVENKEWLGMEHYDPPIRLYLAQKLLLKCFYRGSIGNENLSLNPEEIAFINASNLTNDENGNLIEKWNTGALFRELVLVWGRRCLSENSTLIDPETGKLWTIGDLWDYGKTSLASWTYDQDAKEMKMIRDCELSFEGEQEVFKLNTSSGHSIELTDNHPLMTPHGWTEVKDLKIGDKIAIAPNLPFFGSDKRMNEDRAAVLGYLSSTSFFSAGAHIGIATKDIDVVREFHEHAQNCTNYTVAIEKANDYSLHSASMTNKRLSYVCLQKNSVTCEAKPELNNTLSSLIMVHGLKNKTSEQKFVPTLIGRSTRGCIAAYLKALFSADGQISTSNRDGIFNDRIEITFENMSMGTGVQGLLQRFGIFSTIKQRKSLSRLGSKVCISRSQDVRKFLEYIGFVNQSAETLAIWDRVKESLCDNDPIFVAIASIDSVGKKRTFDLKVSTNPALQNFTADGFIVHNSGKDFITSIIALYEGMKLLEAPGGNPYSQYNLGSAAPFTILTIANSAAQAHVLFKEMRDKVLRSPYFKERLDEKNMTSESIHFLTPHDRIRNEEMKQRGLPALPGSVQIRSGHSNSDSLVGISCYCLLLDEVGLYKQTKGSSSGDAIYNSLAPAVKTYMRKEVMIDEETLKPKIDLETGKEMMHEVFDGKIVCISSPRGKEGIFFDLYNKSHEVPHRLMMRLPTWEVNSRYSRDMLVREFPNMPEEKFRMEFGAEFSGTGGESFFPRDAVENCFSHKNLKEEKFGKPGHVYFAHLDPAVSSHNYAMVVCHKEIFFNYDVNQRDYRIVVDHIKYWTPTPDKLISVEDVDKYMMEINKRFHLGLVTYDQWNCLSVGERVFTANGLMKIEDVRLGDNLNSSNGKMNKVVCLDRAYNVDGFEIETKFGYKVRVTANHPLLVKNKGFIEASLLNIRDQVMLKDFHYDFGRVSMRNEARMAGYLISEGAMSSSRIGFTNTDEFVLADYSEVAAQVVGAMPSVSRRKMSEINSSWLDSTDLRYFGADRLSHIYSTLGLKESDCYTKEVPEFIFRSDKITVAEFLSALYEGDGNVSINPACLQVEYNTSSELLARQIHMLLLGFGIKASLKFFTNKYSKSGKHCPFYRICIYGNNILTFSQEINFRSPTKKNKLAVAVDLQINCSNKCPSRKSKGLRKKKRAQTNRSQHMHDYVIAITPTKLDIIHMEVDGDHTYVANGIISHNSASSIQKLRKVGIPALETRFTKHYKMLIYDNLYELVVSKKLLIPNNLLLKNEMTNLQRKWSSSGGGYSVSPKADGDITTDDITDALAGACFNTMDRTVRRLPQGRLVNTPVSPSSNSRVWMGPQGPMGQGTGKQVSKQQNYWAKRLQQGPTHWR
jgi:intein/homing endonuclease